MKHMTTTDHNPTSGCDHPDDQDHDETCTCSDHPWWTLTEGCRDCDPDHYDENGSLL